MWATFINATNHCQSCQTWEKGKTNVICPQPQSNGRPPTTSQHLQWDKTKIPTVSEPLWSSMIKVVGPLLTFLSNRPAIYFNSKSPKFLNIWPTWIHFWLIIHIMWHVYLSIHQLANNFFKELVTNSPQISEDPLPNLDLPKRSPATPKKSPLTKRARSTDLWVMMLWTPWIMFYMELVFDIHPKHLDFEKKTCSSYTCHRQLRVMPQLLDQLWRAPEIPYESRIAAARGSEVILAVQIFIASCSHDSSSWKVPMIEVPFSEKDYIILNI